MSLTWDLPSTQRPKASLRSVRRPRYVTLNLGAGCHPLLIRSIRIHHIDLPVAIAGADEGDPRPVQRTFRPAVLAGPRTRWVMSPPRTRTLTVCSPKAISRPQMEASSGNPAVRCSWFPLASITSVLYPSSRSRRKTILASVSGGTSWEPVASTIPPMPAATAVAAIAASAPALMRAAHLIGGGSGAQMLPWCSEERCSMEAATSPHGGRMDVAWTHLRFCSHLRMPVMESAAWAAWRFKGERRLAL